jgi:ribosomal-protein-alanine N-acetyltransferase
MNASVSRDFPSIRAMEQQDIAAVHALTMEPPGAAQWSCEAYERLLADPMLCLVLAEADRIVGFVALRVVMEEAEILNLAVEASHRRRGCASRLLRAAEAEAKTRGAVTLFLEVRESNTAAIQFYEKSGFLRSGRRPSYYRDPDEAALVMVRKLTDSRD